MKTLTFFYALWCLVNFCNPIKLSSSFTKCNKKESNFDDCLSGAIKNAITQLDKPLKEHNLPSFEPLFLPFFLPKEDGIKRDLDYKFKNFIIFGHTTITDLKAKTNFEDKTLTISMINPEVRYEHNYVAKGVMFVLPIESSGPALVTAQNVTYTLTFIFEEYTKDNENYLLVVDSELKMAPRAMSGRYDNLFKDKALNDAFCREMSSDWKKPFEHFSSIYFDTLTELFDGI
ncbi:hypothetical protein MTP99_003692 [Tenebrio molitor]|nr:hypothetical protein MTP99_003692 [Tenebrio molitor]